MARRQGMSDIQLAELFNPPNEQRELVRHYTLPAAVTHYCGNHNQLG